MRGGFESPNRLIPVLLDASHNFPALNGSLVELGPPGLVAIGGDLSVGRLFKAYTVGIFPWSVNPITWWSPHRRGIIEFAQFHVSTSLERVLRRKPFVITANQAFREVIKACAEVHASKGCWISPEFIESYTELHKAGHAHSVECWREGRLVGGIYGVAVGGMFAAESMFYRESNASKVALVHLVQALQKSGFTLLDIQMITPTTAAFGAAEISREDFLHRLNAAVQLPVTLRLSGD
jgi:leucyl/phenylalanyl-tRNA--protein transferase